MSLKFGTSGLRGLSEDLKGKACAIYATAFARYLLQAGMAKQGDDILIGQDFRDSSAEVAAVVAGALSRSGLVPIHCGTVPTPALALYGLQLKVAALMITGSHIPADRNGIKFYRPDGEIDKADEVAIAALAQELMADQDAVSVQEGQAEDRQSTVEALFIERNSGLLPENALSGLTIGVYQHSTVARDLFVTVLQSYGATVVPLGRSEHFIPVDTEAVSPETIALLKQWAKEQPLDSIVSADGDGDRPLVTDETGEPLRGDLLGLITARFLKAKVAVTPITSNSGLERSPELTVVRTRVGSPYVISGMMEAKTDGVMGFEANGGLLTASVFEVNGRRVAALPTRDSFLPVLATLYTAVQQGAPLSEVATSVALPIALSDRLENFPLETSGALMTHLRASPANLSAFLSGIGTVKSVSDLDGLRVTLADDRIIHLRPSGNAPEMRCYVEAETEGAAKALVSQGLKTIAAWEKPQA